MHHSPGLRILKLFTAAFFILTWLLSAQAADRPSPEAESEAAAGAPVETGADTSLRLREGLDLENEIGEFRDAGGRIAFYPTSWNRTLTVLENLALERVYAELEKRRERRQWSVSGVVTEYRGGNYLQITRAVMKPRTSLTRESMRAKSPSATSSNSTTRP